jgi:uncharacterized protein YraI
MITQLRTALLAISVVGLSATAVGAAPGIVDRDANLRSGPGTNYRVAAVVPAGAPIEVMDCQGRWCAVAYESLQGYIARSLIDPANAALVAPQYGYTVPSYGYVAPRYGYGPVYGYSGPSIGFSYYDRPGRNWRGYGSGGGIWFGF